jgi:diguanylate cyclase (GGDEF)-like protein
MNETVTALVRTVAGRQAEHERARADLLARTQTVDRLLEFSQTVQGAGKPDQIFDALAHFLETEFALSAVLVATHEPDALPATHLKACRPASLAECPRGHERIGEMEQSSCPCLRQNQPRQFRPECSPVRCGIERCIPLPASQAAYCIPFQVGRKVQAVVHMVLPHREAWTEARRQLAQTYVNAAHSALVSLQLVANAEQQSMTDPLTGLYNRRSMDVLLAREVALAERYDRPLSVAVIDMDRFKQVNDTHGHAAGDHLLRTFADCVRITLRKTDLAFRQGGDEFVIALTQTPLAQAQQVVQKLRQAFAAVDFSDAITNLEKHPTLSVGVAERSAALNLTTTAALLGAADQALYEAKARNRDCICAYEPKAA